MKSVLLSIRPEWCKRIASSKKTIEVRKTRPKIETPFKCYIYCTKDKRDSDRLWILDKQDRAKYFGLTAVCFTCEETPEHCSEGNGKVIGEFVCDKIEYFDSAASEFAYAVAPSDFPCVMPMSEEKALKNCTAQACLSKDDMLSYFGDEDWKAYFWYISELKIYDEPKKLGEFRHCGVNYHFNPAVTKPPQSWCYVEELQ